MKKYHITKRSVFDDLGFSKEEAINLRAKADLMIAIREYIQENALSQKEAAEVLGIDQPQVSRLLNGNIELFTIDKLLLMLSRIKIKVKWIISPITKKAA
jgi:predicted XRE-type DNA-binding protein